jgi:hypothetical protein
MSFVTMVNVNLHRLNQNKVAFKRLKILIKDEYQAYLTAETMDLTQKVTLITLGT